MKGLHCATCRCGDIDPPLRIDTTAPFYALVVECDRVYWDQRGHGRPPYPMPVEVEA